MSSSDLRESPRKPFVLEDFLPYRLAKLSTTVSRSLARLYENRFGVSMGEWRLLANLAQFGPQSANALSDRSAMDKVQISRAVAKAVANGFIARTIDHRDRRRSVLSLTNKGQDLYNHIAPIAQDFEDFLLTALQPQELQMLHLLLDRLLEAAQSVSVERMPFAQYSDDEIESEPDLEMDIETEINAEIS
ncbi:hypothetical protein CCP2SC5_110018 [Azospirillaceae bacterium]